MKKILSAIIATVLIFALSATAFAANTITLQIGNPMFTVDGASQEIDPGRGTAPVIQNDRTLLPIRALIEALGGKVSFSDLGSQQIVHIEYADATVSLVIGVPIAFKDGNAYALDSAPVIMNDRTFLPVRFILENIGCNVEWDESTQTVTITK